MSNQTQDLSPRERRQLRTSQAILDAAREIIQGEGVDGLSMRAIAERIDYSPATLYEYYGSKDEIVSAVCIQGHGLLRDELVRVDAALPVVEYVAELGLAYIRFAVANPDYFRLMFGSLDLAGFIQVSQVEAGVGGREIGMEELLRSAMMEETSSFPILLAAVQRGIQEGVYRTRPGYGILEIAYGCWSLVHGLASLRITHESRFPVDYGQTERETLLRFGLGMGK